MEGLEVGKLTRQHLGRYNVRQLLWPLVSSEAGNYAIGIGLCMKRNSALVEITLPKDANIDAHEYQLCLPSKEERQQKLVVLMKDHDMHDEYGYRPRKADIPDLADTCGAVKLFVAVARIRSDAL